MRNKAEDIAPPTYSFDQLIEMIRTATEVELSAIRGLLTRDDEMELYCMFHVELLTFAVHTRTKDLSC